jgi:tyrosyl-tRNA synthetase
MFLATEEAASTSSQNRGASGYIGFDCTAPSLHVGNLLGIMMLHKLQRAEQGDRADRRRTKGRRSSGDGARKLLTDAEIAAIGGIESVFAVDS